MSQKKVTDFFINRKRGGASYQPSKRVKVVLDGDVLAVNNEVQNKSSRSMVVKTAVRSEKVSCAVTVAVANSDSVKAASKPSACKKSRNVGNIKTNRKTVKSAKNTVLGEGSLSQSTLKCNEVSVDDDRRDETSETIIDFPTAVRDDHGSSPSASPIKRQVDVTETSGNCKRGRNQKPGGVSDVYKTPEKFDFSPYVEQTQSLHGSRLSSARKKLSLHRVESKESSPVFDFKGDSPSKVTPGESSNEITSNKSAPNGSAIACEKLEKCSNLTELRQKLAQFAGRKAKAENAVERARQAVEKRIQEKSDDVAVCSKNEESHSVSDEQQHKMSPVPVIPAYERHSSLAIAGPPSLQLPYRYRLLGDTFRSSDGIVSMLYNRNEICSFSKLKAAVQELTKRNFELSHLGQIKTVYPSAYRFQQEKDLPIFGGKSSCYQLTIEPNFCDSNAGNGTNRRVTFTATLLLERKNTFLHSLVSIVKSYHKEFLKKLNVQINEAEIKRWHPKFNLDDIPDVEPSELPQPPVVKKFSTAKDVLDEIQDNLNPRIQMALEMVSSKSQAVTDGNKVASSNTSSQGSLDGQASTTSLTNRLNAFKGISSSLLERVRAKEAKKLEQEMTRSTEDVKRLEMLQRLPELTRILRTHFVTQKRPAIPLPDVVKSFTSSYASTMGSVEAENHLKLIAEVVPEWMSIVHLKVGSFVKVNRDMDLMTVHDKIRSLIKTA